MLQVDKALGFRISPQVQLHFLLYHLELNKAYEIVKEIIEIRVQIAINRRIVKDFMDKILNAELPEEYLKKAKIIQSETETLVMRLEAFE